MAPPPCPNDFSKSFEIEAREASRTRQQSIVVANRFFSNVGAVGRTGRFISTITDTKYWFAKPYEITTGFEISAARDYKEPGFVLHFIPIFYNMYNRALDAWPAGARFHRYGAAFHEYRPSRQRFHLGWSGGVVTSLITGVTAHIRGDMGQALETAYNSYVSKYCLNPAPPFDTYKRDFFAMGTVFNQARGGNVTGVVARPGPRGRRETRRRDGAGLDVAEVNQWRADAWVEAKRRLGQ